MNIKERAIVKQLIESIENPSVAGVVYDQDADGKMVRTEVNSTKEVERLLDSADYRLGWNNCAKRIRENLKWLLEQNKSQSSKRR